MDKRILLPLVILPAFQTGNMQAADQPAKRPNIILFMVDDMGWEDTSLPFWTEKTHYNEVYATYLTGTITASVRLREQTIPSSGLLSSSS